MKWLTTTVGALFVAVGVLWSLGTATHANPGSADVFVPRELAVIACETIEMVIVYDTNDVSKAPVRKRVDEVEEGEQVLPNINGIPDLEWNITGGKLDCKREVIPLQDAAELQGAPSIGADFSRAIQCSMASMVLAPRWAEQHPGWWPMAIGCPNPIFSDNGTPGDASDDRIVGYKMPECPSTINNMVIKCVFDESEI